MMYVIECTLHQGMDQAAPGVFRISCNAGNAAHIHNRVMHIYLHGIDHDHRCQFILIKPADDIGFFQNGALCVFDFILLPACLKQIIGSNLEGILQKGIKLFQIAPIQFPHLKVAVCFQVSVRLMLFIHK